MEKPSAAELHAVIWRLSWNELATIFRKNGFIVTPKEKIEELQDALRVNVEDGEIPFSDVQKQ